MVGPKVSKKINQDFFKIWSPEMAYVLGFFIADGCLSISQGRPSNPYTFNLTSKDLEHLQNIQKVFHSNHKISRKFGSSGGLAYQIQVRNSVIATDLIKLGVTLKKTHTLKPIAVPEKYFSDYVRGFFDGDGTVYIYKVNGVEQLKSGFIAVGLDFIRDFNNRICNTLHIPEKSIHKDLEEGEEMIKYNICFYIDDSEKLAKFMYESNPSLYLDRKKEIFDKWKLIKRRTFVKRNYPSKIGWHLSEGFKAI